MRARLPPALAAAAAMCACSGEPVGEVPSAAERGAARALVGQIAGLVELSADPLAPGTLLEATSSEPIAQLLAPPGTRVVVPSRAGIRRDDLDACATVTANTVSFSECALAEHVVDGTISRQGADVVADLDDVFLFDAGLHGAASVSGRITTGPGGLSGTLSIGAQWSVDGDDTLIDAVVRLDEVELDTAQCPISGSIEVTADLAGPALRESRVIRFGPTCGDVTLSR